MMSDEERVRAAPFLTHPRRRTRAPGPSGRCVFQDYRGYYGNN
jgi:hypothetical protein